MRGFFLEKKLYFSVKFDELVKNRILMAKEKAPPNLIKLARRANPEE